MSMDLLMLANSLSVKSLQTEQSTKFEERLFCCFFLSFLIYYNQIKIENNKKNLKKEKTEKIERERGREMRIEIIIVR